MIKIPFVIAFLLLFGVVGSAQKMPKGMEKALAAQEKAMRETEKSGRTDPKRKQTSSNYRNRPIENNRDILRRINERINQSYSSSTYKPSSSTKTTNNFSSKKISDLSNSNPIAEKQKN